jgi:2-succinyl-6-hydroxy-2,4-cyclohexadiene-1-carboxylate synthase
VPDPSAPRIIALHGFTGDAADFAPLRALAPGHWQWHCPDLPGHGTQSAAANFSLEHHLAYLEAQRRQFDATSTVDLASPSTILLGYSMGGRIALHWILKNPRAFRALVLIGASPGIANARTRQTRRRSDAALAQRLTDKGLADFLETWWSQPLFAGLQKNLRPEALTALRDRRHRANSARALVASLLNVGTGTLPPLWKKLPMLPLPVLCITGAEDSKFSRVARRMCARLPNGTAISIPGTHHLPHLENPALVAAQLNAFVTLNNHANRPNHVSGRSPPDVSACANI